MRNILLTLFLSVSISPVFATEGMWIPLLIAQLNESEMQAMGMKMSAEDIYSVNQGSLKDAIVHFGGFCTGEIISDKGLVLTNHHCGKRNIQQLSSLDNNYLEDGFWAKNQGEEIPSPGLYVRFIIRIEEVSAKVLEGVTDDLSEGQRKSIIRKNIRTIKVETVKEDYQQVVVKPFFDGNQYFLFITETYRDIRFVGTPPAAIGDFGADTDNWAWPRHTGDFSMFRIYADKDNKPARYSPYNVPFKPKHFLPVSTSGISEGDFTLVFGFPGRTNEYLPAVAIEQTVDVLNPIKIGIRDKSLEIMNAAMEADEKTALQYAAKQFRITNSWKKWIGQNQGIKSTGVVAKRRVLEKEFSKRVNEDTALKLKYGHLLKDFESLYRQLEPYAISKSVIDEIINRNIELFQLANQLHSYVSVFDNNGEAAFKKRIDRLETTLVNFYKDYHPDIDREIFAVLMEKYFNGGAKREHLSMYAMAQIEEAGKDYEQWAKTVFSKSILSNEEKTLSQFKNDPVAFIQTVKTDYAYQLGRSIIETAGKAVNKPYSSIQNRIALLQRQYMRALMEVFPEKRFYPDANGTLRVSYGKVAGFSPRDGIYYKPFTYLSGVIEKYIPGDYEFDVPQKLRELYDKKDFGIYGEDGRMPVCFIGTNHTSGGTSGSPVIDAEGNLVGLNFDRVWEGTMSDLYYDASICRNIMVDIRYVLFIIDKFAGATHLIEEMKIIP